VIGGDIVIGGDMVIGGGVGGADGILFSMQQRKHKRAIQSAHLHP
jgi:hypothetical protein